MPAASSVSAKPWGEPSPAKARSRRPASSATGARRPLSVSSGVLMVVAGRQHRGGRVEAPHHRGHRLHRPRGPAGLVTTIDVRRGAARRAARAACRAGKSAAVAPRRAALHHEDLEVLRERPVLEAVVEHERGRPEPLDRDAAGLVAILAHHHRRRRAAARRAATARRPPARAPSRTPSRSATTCTPRVSRP